MPYDFADSFDLYATVNDMSPTYWDTLTGSWGLGTGRFTGGRAINPSPNATLVRSSNVNDPVHHITCSFENTQAISGTTPGLYFTFFDGATAQCSVVFQQGGNIVLTSGTTAGAVLATYTNAAPIQSVWYAFEFEVVINNTTGSFTVRRNGNPNNDFTATGLNTRASANNYANRLQTGGAPGGVAGHMLDDMYWRSSAASGSWLGDLRCLARMPFTDSSVQFTRSATTSTLTVGNYFSTFTLSTVSFFSVFVPTFSGTIAAATFNVNNNYTAHVKAVIYDNTGPNGGPGTVIGTGSITTNPIGPPPLTNPITFSPAVSVTKGQIYYLGLCPDATITFGIAVSGAPGTGGNPSYYSQIYSYAAFPPTNPVGPVSNGNPVFTTFTVTVTRNADFVGEAQQDALTTYVYDSTVGDADFYGISAVTTTGSTIAGVTRAFMEKSDAGTRTAAVRLRSGSTTVSAPTVVLTPGTWQWSWRMDITDPNTGSAWTTAATNAVNIGPLVVA